MAQDHVTKLKCEETGDIHYTTRKNRKQNPDKMSLRKYNRKVRKHTVYTETK